MDKLEKPNSVVTFLNQPKMLEFEAQASFNERRLSLIPHVEKYLLNNENFRNKKIEVTFIHDGQSSLVCVVETMEEKMIFKVALSNTHSFGEALFLKTWEQAGVKVPQVFEDGLLDGQPYILMEYIDAPLLGQAYSPEEMISKGVYEEMGRTLRLMHTPKASGFGRVVDDRAEFKTFSEWLQGEDMNKRVDYVLEHDLLPGRQEQIALAFKILNDYIGGSNESSYCHDDFGGNIFATSPITVFDPNSRFNNGYLDVGRTIINHVAQGKFPKGFVEAYFEDIKCDEKVLQASVLLNAVMKLPYQHKKERWDIIKNIQEHLAENEHLLSL